MHTPQSVKIQIESLINQANATTGKEDTDLTSAVGSLVEGFGQGGSDDETIITYKYISGLNHIHPDTPDITQTVIFHSPVFNGNMEYAFSEYTNRGFKKLVLIVDNQDNIYRMTGIFGDNKFIEEIDFSGLETEQGVAVNNLQYFSRNASKLKRIIGSFNTSSITASWQATSAFVGCTLLEEIRFVPSSIFVAFGFANSSLLSDASIQSIIDGLADLTGQTAQTITFHKDVKAKLTETQIATITGKNWTLA